MTLTFDLLTSKVVSESHVTCATSVPTLIFLGLFVLDFRPDIRDRRQTDIRRASSINAPRWRHNNFSNYFHDTADYSYSVNM